MFHLISYLGDYYYIIIVLQAICAIHALRSGNQGRWIWLIVFLPLIGCVMYFFTEILTKQHVSSIQTDVANLVNPGAKIKELEKKFKFSDTLANRTALADAYLEKGFYDEAIKYYEPALTGLFESNEHIIHQLIKAYFAKECFDDIIKIAPRIANTINFPKHRSAILYAIALEKTGRIEAAETQFKTLNHRFSNYEARYEFGQFLVRQDKIDDADQVYSDMVNEGNHMSRREMGESKQWIDKAAKELNNFTA